MAEEQNTDNGTQTNTEIPEGGDNTNEDRNQPSSEGVVDNGNPEPESDNPEDKKTDTGKDTTEEDTKKEDTEKPEVPETYEFPEDLGMSDEEKTKYSELFKKHKAPQEAVDDFVNEFKEQAKQVREASVKAWYDQVKKWGDEAAKNEEYGGQDFQKNVDSVIMPLVSKFGDPELVEELDKTGFGNNPRLLGMFYRIGKEIGIEADFVEGQPGGLSDTQSIADIMYPTMRKNKKE